jgi:hypothetical protein
MPRNPIVLELRAKNAARKLHASVGPATLPLIKRATELDPQFAMAHAFLGGAYGELGESAPSAENISKVYQLRQGTSDHEKFLITA